MRTRLRIRDVTAGQLGLLTVTAMVAWALKRHYADASTDALSWILAPTTSLVSLVTGIAFVAVPGEGYFSAERLFLIEKACAGINFMIAAFLLVTVMMLGRARFNRDAAWLVGAALAASYVAAVVVNALRIVIALWVAEHAVAPFGLTAGEVHRLEGIAVYFGGLLLLYEIIARMNRGASVWRVTLPLGCYYLVTLALPLVHGTAHINPAFITHALTVMTLPLVVVLFVFGIPRAAHSLNRTIGKV